MTTDLLIGVWQQVLQAGIRWTPVLLIAALTARLLKSRCARERHAVWMLSLVALAVLPVASSHFTMGSIQVPSVLRLALGPPATHVGARELPPESAVSVVSPGAAIGRSAGAEGRGGAAGELPASTPSMKTHSISQRSLYRWNVVLGMVWAAVALLLLTWELFAWRTTSVLRRGARRVGPEELPAGVAPAEEGPQILSGDTRIPLLFGIRHPRILLPSDWPSWPEAWLRATILHERAHALRRDILVLGLARLVRAVFWFHPGIWFGVRELKREAEQATDEHVLRTGMDRFDYADALLGLARHLGGRRIPLRGISMAAPAGIQERVLRVARVDTRSLHRRGKARLAAAVAPIVFASFAVAAPAVAPAAVEWLERVAVDGGGTLWHTACPSADTLCARLTADAVRLLQEADGGGVAAVQDVSTGRVIAYAFVDRVGNRPAVPAVPVSAVAGLPLAAAWWDAGMGDRLLPCPAVINLPRSGSFANPNGLDTGMVRAPADVLAMQCATGAIAMGWYIDRELGPSHLHEQFVRLGFAPSPGDAFWPDRALPEPAVPAVRSIPGVGEETWILAGSAHGTVRTTPLHVIRFLQATANGGRMLHPVPPVASSPGGSSVYMSAATANRVLDAMSLAEGPPSESSTGERLVGIVGAASAAEAEVVAEMFGGLLLSNEGKPRYAVAIWLPRPTGNRSHQRPHASRVLAQRWLITGR